LQYGPGQTVVHEPQWSGFVWVLTHAPSHMVSPAVQDAWQLPFTHRLVPQAILHEPQLSWSDIKSTHSGHAVIHEGQFGTQLPPEQASCSPQAVVQLPQ
jgi:hypothetical protein